MVAKSMRRANTECSWAAPLLLVRSPASGYYFIITNSKLVPPHLTAKERRQLAHNLRTDHHAPLHQILNAAEKLQQLANAPNQCGLRQVLAILGAQLRIDKQESQLQLIALRTQFTHFGAQLGKHANDFVQYSVVGGDQLEQVDLLVVEHLDGDWTAFERIRFADGVMEIRSIVVSGERAQQAIVRDEKLAKVAQLRFAGNGCNL